MGLIVWAGTIIRANKMYEPKVNCFASQYIRTYYYVQKVDFVLSNIDGNILKWITIVTRATLVLLR